MKFLIIILFLTISCTKEKSTKLFLTCRWDSYNTNYEYFVIDIKKKTVSWINQNREVSKIDITKTLISFSGTKKKILLSNKTLNDIKLKFTIVRNNFNFQVNILSPNITAQEISKIGNDGKIYTRGCEGNPNLKKQTTNISTK